jgi:hypothetical protein
MLEIYTRNVSQILCLGAEDRLLCYALWKLFLGNQMSSLPLWQAPTTNPGVPIHDKRQCSNWLSSQPPKNSVPAQTGLAPVVASPPHLYTRLHFGRRLPVAVVLGVEIEIRSRHAAGSRHVEYLKSLEAGFGILALLEEQGVVSLEAADILYCFAEDGCLFEVPNSVRFSEGCRGGGENSNLTNLLQIRLVLWAT